MVTERQEPMMRTSIREAGEVTWVPLLVGLALAGVVFALIGLYRPVADRPLVDLTSARSWPPVGTCLDLGKLPVAALVDCDEEHDAEIVGTVVIAPRGTPLPQPGALVFRPADGCAGVPPVNPGFALRHLGVQETDWTGQAARGPVLALCVAEPLAGGSARGSAR